MTYFFSQNQKTLKTLFTELKIVVGVVISYWKETKLKMAKHWMEKHSNRKTKDKILF